MFTRSLSQTLLMRLSHFGGDRPNERTHALHTTRSLLLLGHPLSFFPTSTRLSTLQLRTRTPPRPQPRHPLRTARSTSLTAWGFPRNTASPARCARATPRLQAVQPVEPPNGARRARRHTRTPHQLTRMHPRTRHRSGTPTLLRRHRVTYRRATRCSLVSRSPPRRTRSRQRKPRGDTPVLSHRRGQCPPRTSPLNTTLAPAQAHPPYRCTHQFDEVDQRTAFADRVRAAPLARHAALAVQPHHPAHSASRKPQNAHPHTAHSQKTL